MPPCQVLQLEHAEDQRDGRNSQHEHNKHVFFCRPGDITVHRMWTWPGLKCRETGECVASELCFTLNNSRFSMFTLQTYRGLRKIPYRKYWRLRNTTCMRGINHFSLQRSHCVLPPLAESYACMAFPGLPDSLKSK